MMDNDNKCGTCEKKEQACISFLAHENAMMHKDTDNEMRSIGIFSVVP